jgi:uncharacterized protein YegL
MSRRQPLYLVVDRSGSMRGAAISAVQYGLETLLSALRQDAQARAAVHVSLLHFAREVAVAVPLNPLDAFRLPALTVPESGPSHLGLALSHLLVRIQAEKQADDLPPIVFVLGDGAVSDLLAFHHAAARLRALPCAAIVLCSAGPLPTGSPLRQLSEMTLGLDTADATRWMAFFRIQNHVEATSMAAPASESTPTPGEVRPGGSLPPPPPEIHIVF